MMAPDEQFWHGGRVCQTFHTKIPPKILKKMQKNMVILSI